MFLPLCTTSQTLSQLFLGQVLGHEAQAHPLREASYPFLFWGHFYLLRILKVERVEDQASCRKTRKGLQSHSLRRGKNRT